MGWPDPDSLIRPHIRTLEGYVPGEQAETPGLIKLNTNENPYPPAPAVRRAIKQGADARLRLYPSPTAEPLRSKLAVKHGCQPENLVVGNGSDELLALATRAFAEPLPSGQGGSNGSVGNEAGSPKHSGSRIQFFYPSYSLYPVLAQIHGGLAHAVPLKSDFSMPSVSELEHGGNWDFEAALTYITTPNAPSGRGYGKAELEALCRRHRGVVILDEAYVDFAEEDAAELALKYPHVIVSRTFSKAFSLCYQRIGYCLGHPKLIRAFEKIRDSYSVNGLGQLAALTTLEHPDYYQRNFKRIIRQREALKRALERLDFEVLPSQANFLLVRPPRFSAESWRTQLRDRNILVRWFEQREIRDWLRITIGTPAQMRTLVETVKAILSQSQ